MKGPSEATVILSLKLQYVSVLFEMFSKARANSYSYETQNPV